MAGRLFSNVYKSFGSPVLSVVRQKHHFRGKPPDKARSLQQRLRDENPVDPALAFRVDIGFPSKPLRDRSKAMDQMKEIWAAKKDTELEKLSREGKLQVPLEKIEAEWRKTLAPSHIKAVADHYGIFRDLFGDAFFVPQVLIDVSFPQTDGSLCPVYWGNVVKPAEAMKAPEVSFEAEPDSLWTLTLTNLDGHLTEENAEYVHWFIGNIPGNEVSKGEEIFPYMPPFPPAGTGYHRLAFVLYKQTQKIDYSSMKKAPPCFDLSLRTFQTLEFYRPQQDNLTPAGLAFCQTDYDPSVKDIFHKMLGSKMPIFEYDFPPHYVRPQEWFPKKYAFNTYLDKYRDPKEINKEYLLDKLKNSHPFEAPPPKLKFPNAQPFDKRTPSWLRTKLQKDRLGHGRIKDM